MMTVDATRNEREGDMFREEYDSMGRVEVPSAAYYGASTERAVRNFPISGMTFPPVLIESLARIKESSALVNEDLGILDKKLAGAIRQAAREIIQGRMADQFVVDVFQTGSGTSTNMNLNEVIAARANEILTGVRGGKSPVHPNDHVNRGQSSNDVFPSAMHLSALLLLRDDLLPALESLHNALSRKAAQFSEIPKIGRTHLQDAVPIRMGQEFSGYAVQIHHGIDRIQRCRPYLEELALGGTAVGNGINTHPEFARRVIGFLSQEIGLTLREAQDHFEAQSARDAVVETSGALKTIAVSLVKISNDIRWMGSGPRCGLGEIALPDLQPGSSIMPGKVNPVIPEVVLQVAAQVIGNDATITLCGTGGNFELNTMMPVMAHNFLQSISLLDSACRAFTEFCVEGIRPREDVCRNHIRQSLAMITLLVPDIGYDHAARIAGLAYSSGKTVAEVAKESGISDDLVKKLFIE